MENLIKNLWNDYLEKTKNGILIQKTLKLEKEVPIDHISFRTANKTNLSLKKVCLIFFELGYEIKGSYNFQKRNLHGVHLENIKSPKMPKIFISELQTEKFSPFLNMILRDSFSKIITFPSQTLLSSERQWEVNKSIYGKLLNESEYASWLYINGFQANHFSINVTDLKNYNLEKICTQLVKAGISLNLSGSNIIKGSKDIGLKQASVMAERVPVFFSDCLESAETPHSYLEFSERFIINGSLFNGFNAEVDDEIAKSCIDYLAYTY